jgi:phosphoadenosine phosphosulfate reductase
MVSIKRQNPFATTGFFTNTEACGDYVQKAINFIQEHEPKEGYFVGFSGGKDSIITLELVKMAGVRYQVYFNCTTIDPPEIYKFIRQFYPDVIWKYPKMSFWQGIKKNGIPFRTARWCCRVLKKDSTKDVLLKHRIMGIRAEEGYRRARRPIIDAFDKNIIVYKPIFSWLEWQVWEFIEKNNLPYPSLYDEGFDRVGCIICPFMSKGKKKQAMERWPNPYKIFEKVVKEWYPTAKKYKNFQTAEELLKFWYDY